MSEEEEAVRKLIDTLVAEKLQISLQIAEAKSKAKTDGIYADRAWLTSAIMAGRIKGKQISKLQLKLAELVKARKNAEGEKRRVESRNFERVFFECARRTLPAVLYEQILQETLSVAAGEDSKL